MMVVMTGDNGQDPTQTVFTVTQARNLFVRNALSMSVLPQDAIDALWVDYMPGNSESEALAEDVNSYGALPGELRPPTKAIAHMLAQKHSDDFDLVGLLAVSITDPDDLREFVEAFPQAEKPAKMTSLLAEADEYTGPIKYNDLLRARNAAAAAKYLDEHGRDTKEGQHLSSSIAAGSSAFRDAVLHYLTSKEMIVYIIGAVMGLSTTTVTRNLVSIVNSLPQEDILPELHLNKSVAMNYHANLVDAMMRSDLFGGCEGVFHPVKGYLRSVSEMELANLAKETNARHAEHVMKQFETQVLLEQYDAAIAYVMHTDLLTTFGYARMGPQAEQIYRESLDLMLPHQWVKWANGKLRGELSPPWAALVETDAAMMMLEFGPKYRDELREIIHNIDRARKESMEKEAEELRAEMQSELAAAVNIDPDEMEMDEIHIPDHPYIEGLWPAPRILTSSMDTDLESLAADQKVASVIAGYMVMRTAQFDAKKMSRVIDVFFQEDCDLSADRAIDVAFGLA